jgi:hypothetical protein
MMATRTHVHYFDPDMVDEKVGKAYQALETDLLERKEVMEDRQFQAAERRLELLRHAWALLLEPVIE